MQTAEGLNRRVERVLGLGEVGDVDGEERRAQGSGDGLAVRPFPIQDRDLRTV